MVSFCKSILRVLVVGAVVSAAPQTITAKTTVTTTQCLSASTISASTSTSTVTPTPIPTGTIVAPKVVFIANTFEYSYLRGYNFSNAYTAPMLDSAFNCTSNNEICMLAVGQELVSAMQLTVLEMMPRLNLTETYFIITGTGGANPKVAAAGGVSMARFTVQWEWGSMFLGDDLPANFSGQYFYAYAQLAPDSYPATVGTEVYELNQGLIDRWYNLTHDLEFEEVSSSLQEIRKNYPYAPAQHPPFLAKCDVVSAQVYWHGDVAGENVEYYTSLVTSGLGSYCNTNEDDQGRVLGLFHGAEHGLVDFSRVAIIKAFSNFDRPPTGMTAYQSRYFVGEGATEPGLNNAWMVIKAVAHDVLENWDEIYSKGVKAPNYVGDIGGSLGGTPDFGKVGTAAAGSVQGA
ncbi:hypothetical protein V502_01579 [Pseudogymnoascus sp. VKM F-4520 (FW-2644)]|nr:hypothetical protein V502_01579 [Pseudogymnoascus sp. VKM F-4520 (FW-2644)]